MDWSWNPGSDLRTCLSLLAFCVLAFVVMWRTRTPKEE